MNILKQLLDLITINNDDCLISESQLNEMARVREIYSGIPYHIYVSTKLPVKGLHGPRIKVSNIKGTYSSTDNFVVTISKDPVNKAGTPKCSDVQLEDIKDWVKLNYKQLMKYWNKEYKNDDDFYAEIIKI